MAQTRALVTSLTQHVTINTKTNKVEREKYVPPMKQHHLCIHNHIHTHWQDLC